MQIILNKLNEKLSEKYREVSKIVENKSVIAKLCSNLSAIKAVCGFLDTKNERKKNYLENRPISP